MGDGRAVESEAAAPTKDDTGRAGLDGGATTRGAGAGRLPHALALQRTAGNQATAMLLQRRGSGGAAARPGGPSPVGLLGPPRAAVSRPRPARVIQRDGGPVVIGAIVRRSDHQVTLDAIAKAVVPGAVAAQKTKVGKYLNRGLGVGGAGWFRSDEVRAFRKLMKTSAREAAYEDVGVEAQREENYEEAETTSGPATQAYVRQEATSRAYTMAKESVDNQLSDLAGNWMELHWDDQAVLDDVTRATMDAAWLVLKENPAKNVKKARKRGEQVAKETALEIATRIKRELQERKNALVKPEEEAGEEGTQEQREIAQQVGTRAHQERIGLRSVQESIKANTTDEAIGKFGAILDTAIPHSGDRVALSVELQIPIGHSPGFISIKLSGTAARGTTGATTSGVTTLGDPRRLEVMGHFQLGAGAEAFGIRGDLSVGMFVRAGANAGTAAAMKALNYGWYRAATGINKHLAWLWSGSSAGQTMGNKERAETWAAMIEEQVFDADDSAFADVGGSAGASGAVNAGPWSAGIGVGGELFKRYDKQSLEESLGDDFARPVADGDAATRRMGNVKGQTMGSFGVSAETEVTINGQTVGFAASLSMENRELERGGARDDWGVEISATLGFSGGSMNAVEKIAAGFIAGSLGVAQKLAVKLDEKQKASKKKRAGGGMDFLSDVAVLTNAGLENKMTDALADLWSVDSPMDNAITDSPGTAVEQAAGLDTGSSVQAAITFGKTGGAGVFRFELRSTKSLDIKVGIGNVGLSVSAEKGRRLFGLGVEDGELALDVLGTRPTQSLE